MHSGRQKFHHIHTNEDRGSYKIRAKVHLAQHTVAKGGHSDVFEDAREGLMS